MLIESIQNLFSRLKKFRVNKLILFLFAVALCAIALAIVVCYLISTAHPPVNIAVDFKIIENFGETHAITNIAPWVSAAGGLLSSIIASNSQSATNRMNYYMMKEQNKFNALEAQKQRDWQATQWLSEFNAENAYNDPKNQMARLEAAGVNPFIAAENTTKIGSTAANPSVPSAAAATAAQYHPVISPWASSQFPQNLSAIVGAFKTLAEAKKAGAETTRIENLLNSEVENLQQDVVAKKLMNELTSKYAGQKYEKEISLLGAQILNTDRDTLKKWFEIGEVNAKIHNLAQDTLGKRLANNLTKDTYIYLVNLAEQNLKNAQEQQRLMQHQEKQADAAASASQAAAFNSYAQGKHALELAKTESEKRSFVVDNARSLAQMSAYDANKMLRTLETQVDLTDLQQQYMNFTIDLLRQTKDFNERYELLRALGQVLGGSASIAISHKLGE